MTKKRALLIVGLALLLAAAGVVYAHWQDSLRVEVDIATGTIDPQWSLTGTNDDGVGWPDEPQPSTVYTYEDPTSNDPSGPYAAGTVTRVYTAGFNFSDTGWAGWSCPAGSYPVAGSDGEGHAMQVSKAAVPSDPQYPIYPHYTYTPPEVGWVWQSAADGQGSTGLVLWVDCMSGGTSTRYDKDVADCFAELLPDAAGNPDDLLHVTIDNAYPSYWCTVKADLHNVGTVPVKLQSIALTNGLDAVIQYQIDDAEGALGCGYQLDPGEPVDVYLSFHPLNAAEQDADYSFDMDLTWVNYNEYDSNACLPMDVIRIDRIQPGFGDGGWAGWSCPAGSLAIGGGIVSSTNPVGGHGVAATGAPAVDGFNYPVYPHYTFGVGETGYVVHDLADGLGNTISFYVLCDTQP